jgi:hypothetical protein
MYYELVGVTNIHFGSSGQEPRGLSNSITTFRPSVGAKKE